MTEFKELYTNFKSCSENARATGDNINLMSSCTVENLLAKYLIDFAIEENNVLGYLNDLSTFKEILEQMKDLGFAFSVRDSDARQKQREKNKKISLNGESNNTKKEFDTFNHLTVFYQLKAMPIKFFGLPFTIDKTTHYQCAYGCKYYKSRAGCTKLKTETLNLKQVKKKKKVGSKKMGCLAKMTIKHITVYPEYKLNVESDWRKKRKLIENLRKDLSDSSKVVSQFQRFYLSVSLQSSHNHPPIIVKPKLKVQKLKSHKLLVREDVKEESSRKKEQDLLINPGVLTENDWGYIELASSNLKIEHEVMEEIPVKTLNLKNENYFHTFLKFPGTTSTIFEQVEYKPNEIEIEIKSFEPTENVIPTIEVYEYQPTLEELQILFKEKLKNLYTLCTNCSNGSLILRLASDLEQVEMQLRNDVNFSNF